MLVPTNTFPGSKCFRDLGFVEVGGLYDIECAGKKSGRLLFAERHGLLGGERESVFFGVIIDVSRRGLAGQPFAHVTLMQARLLRKLGWSDRRTVGHRF